jgi:hypothetical protein
MKTKLLWTTAAALFVVFAAGPVRADDPTPSPPPEKINLTKEQKAEAKAKRKADLAAAKASGEVSKGGTAMPATPYKASGTHQSRSAERKANRKKLAEANKKGELPQPTEAEANPKK